MGRNAFCEIVKTLYPRSRAEAERGENAPAWMPHFRASGEKLQVRME